MIPSPYLTSVEAAAYLRLSQKALYKLVERGKLKPLPGSHTYRFTKEMLDNYLLKPRAKIKRSKH